MCGGEVLVQCDDMWQAANRQCMDTTEKGIQRSVPKGFPYVYVQWSDITGPAGSLTHVIEDEKKFKRNFAQDVLAGMMDLSTSEMLRRSEDSVQIVVGCVGLV